MKQYVDALMTRAVRPICNLLQISGHNRARQRDKWAHILDELVNLQDEVSFHVASQNNICNNIYKDASRKIRLTYTFIQAAYSLHISYMLYNIFLMA